MVVLGHSIRKHLIQFVAVIFKCFYEIQEHLSLFLLDLIKIGVLCTFSIFNATCQSAN